MVDKHWRSAAKAISWRTVGTIDTIIISWLITGQLTFAISIGAVELFTKMFLYYGHERIWNKIRFGRIEAKGVDYSI
ncbi:MAG TPA: hypothetical protein DET40_11005 [Lentisphaeria bacterium]|nr:MAG: hypothetical protein A2X45_20185 [Lentisphaerae bacterium GWF2_50_93]HCE44066.1 hypothetical protein [Lentisphaeria bacterium]